MESFIKKKKKNKNPTCLTSLSHQGHFMLMELKIMLDSQCGLFIKGPEDIWQNTWLIKELIVCIQEYKLYYSSYCLVVCWDKAYSLKCKVLLNLSFPLDFEKC